MIIFSLSVGALIDRRDRKRVMIYCDIGRAAVLATIWRIYACAWLKGALFVFSISQVAALSRAVFGAGNRPNAKAQCARGKADWGGARGMNRS